MATQWWQQQPTLRYKTPTGVILANGVQDVEKGDVYNSPPGSPVSIPIPSIVAFEDHEHVVLRTNQGIFSFLHVNPDVPVDTAVPSNSTFAQTSYIGSRGYPDSYYDPNSHMTYQESGSIIEFGSYDTVQHAAARETYVNGVDQPFNFSGISDPLPIVSRWQSGNTPQTPVTTQRSSFPIWLIPLAIGFFVFLLWRKRG